MWSTAVADESPGLVYLPMANSAADYLSSTRSPKERSGKTLWDRAFGTARRNGPWGVPSMLPFEIGTPNNGGPVTTASGLIFIAATTDDFIRVIDLNTGKTVWSHQLSAGG